MSLQQRLIAGLEAQDWIQTASRGPWVRFAKWGRGAMYVLHQPMRDQITGEAESLLWFSELSVTAPTVPVIGPIHARIVEAGDLRLKEQGLDTQALLIELLDLPSRGKLGAQANVKPICNK